MDSLSSIMDTTRICRNFPSNPPMEIYRDSFLDTIEQLFEKHAIVTVEGPEGIGKTTLLAQFAKRHPENCISIFITPATRSSYDPESLRVDLLCQASWILSRKVLEDSELETIDIKSSWGIKRTSLQKRAQLYRKKIYFIVDGVAEIPDDNSNYRELILDLLPFGFGNEFRFLISGDPEKLPKKIKELIPNKSFMVSPFTLNDVQQNLIDLGFSKEEVAELYKVYRFPSQYAIIRRSIQSGYPKNEFLEKLAIEKPSLLELEWRNVDLSNQILSEVLAVLAYSSLTFSEKELAEVLGISFGEVSTLLKSISFITKSETGIAFVSFEQQKFAQAKLYKLKETAENRIVEYLKNSKDPMAVVYLPNFYEKSENYAGLLNYLTPEILTLILKNSQSLIPLRETTRMGVGAAYRLQRDGDLISLGLQSAIVDELYSSDVWESEINALIALRNTEAALTLVERASTIEDRLLLLSVLANAKEKHKLDIQGLEERIKNTYQQVNHHKLGEKAIDIAANLINIDSMRDLAFDLVEKNTDSEEGENALDWALAKLSVKAIAESDSDSESLDVIAKIQKRINDPKAQNFLTLGSLYHLDFSAMRIINEAKKMERVSEQLYLLRSWLMKNREAEDAYEVVSFSLDVAINTTDYAPNARDFRELATPLPHIKNIEKRKHLISIIDGQMGTIERLGPIEDYVRVNLILAIAEKGVDFDDCLNRFIEAYLYSSALEDLSTKSACLARVLSALEVADPEKSFEPKDKIHSLVFKELSESIDLLLTKTADQYLVTKNIIRALARTCPQNAYEIILKLNGEDRRNRAISDLIEAILNVPDKKLNFGLIKEYSNNVTSPTIRDDLVLQTIARINNIEEKETPEKGIIFYYINLIKEIQDASMRCNACCLGLALIPKFNLSESIKDQLVNLLAASWDSIDVGWVKVDTGFRIVEVLTDFPELSEEVFKKVEIFRESIFLDSSATTTAYIACAKLCLRAFSGLFSQHLDTESDLLQVIALIENIPSMTERVGLYTDLALKYRSANRQEKFNEVVSTKLKTCLEKIPETDGLALQLAIIASAPALYLNHTVSTMDMIQKIKYSGARDRAYAAICSYILTKRYDDPHFDPGGKKAKKITYEEAKDIINILQHIDYDTTVYYFIAKITESIDSYRNSLSKNQKAEITRSLDELIDKKFPNNRYIKHLGYKIVSTAQVNTIRETKPSDWNDLISQAKTINTADQVLILSNIAECLPNALTDKRKPLLAEAENLIKDIPSIYDQIDRYEQLSEAAINFDRQLSQKYLKSGMEILVKHDENDFLASQRSYIDLAYKINPDFAAQLASMADNDPARAKTAKLLQKRYAQLKLKETISEAENSGPKEINGQETNYPSAAWMLLGSLNAERVASMRFEAIREYAKAGANLALSEAYPIYGWLIQNSIHKYQDTTHANTYIRPLFDATISGCNLIISIAQKSTSQIKIAKSNTGNEGVNSRVIADMDPETAISLLKSWLKHNLKDELYIADGYFGLEELWIIQEVKGVNPRCKVYVLTSKEHHEQKKITSPQDAYPDYWRINISDQEPPNTRIVIAANPANKSPIHDRWWISAKSGVRIGTSTNSIGDKRISEIVDLTVSEAEEREEIIKRFVVYEEREYKGDKIRYVSFTL